LILLGEDGVEVALIGIFGRWSRRGRQRYKCNGDGDFWNSGWRPYAMLRMNLRKGD